MPQETEHDVVTYRRHVAAVAVFLGCEVLWEINDEDAFESVGGYPFYYPGTAGTFQIPRRGIKRIYNAIDEIEHLEFLSQSL